MILSGWSIPLISRPDFGVDLFILLSGFLMVFHYELRQAKEPWENPATWRIFWGRRLFRIAPLYYLALGVALIAGPHIGHARAEIAAVLPKAATPAARYFDQSLGNIVAHVTFVFGQMPHFAFRTSLPDWSIGLEMAFYLVFPFLMLASKRVSLPVAAVAATVLCFAIVKRFHVYAAGFEEPAFLPLKLNIFFSGMLIAGALTRSGFARGAFLALAVVLASVHFYGNFRDAEIRVMLAAVFAFLVHGQAYSATKNISERIDEFLALGVFKRLGDLSYGVYLLHLLVLIPLMAVLISTGLPPFARFLGGLLLTALIVFTAAGVTFAYIEQPGIRLGKAILTNRKQTFPASGETVIVPEAT